ncbi:response regulator transcription factor [Micromonospora polyrhachis]|uniref:DNA-binding NarL/FixJ family response regulator n=1 Tax=Micromonospora polyrhachis TaxID=1282883 RepID=A0A7W7SKZ9_9ACTN|nr:response regulator transcription factor [Micromonospora polyrhachis]MBB4956725.1 DNA-binding NarL/FixJ family response regulator [Micromonospora polyrhachis]
MIRLVIVDDQALVREGLSLILAAQSDIDVVAALPDGPALLDFVDRQPDAVEVVLLDLYLPGADGVQTLERLRRQFPQVRARVLMLTTIGRAAEIQRALAAGADGFVLKDATGDELASAVRGVHGGVTTLSTSAAEALWPGRRNGAAGNRPGSETDPLDSPAGRVASLTPREREILDRLARGLANQEIARDLHLAERTVKTHVSSVLAKLGVTSRTQAALLARDLSGVG